MRNRLFPGLALFLILVFSGFRELSVGEVRLYVLEILVLALSLVYLPSLLRISFEFRRKVLPLFLLPLWGALSFVFQSGSNLDYSSFFVYSGKLTFNILVILIVTSLILANKTIVDFRRLAVLSALVFSCFFAWQLLSGNIVSRFTGGLRDPNYFCSVLILILFPVLAGSLDRRLGWIVRSGCLILFLLTLAQCLLTFSRAGILAIAAGLLFLVAGLLATGRSRQVVALVVMALLIAAPVTLILRSDSLPYQAEQLWQRWGIQRLSWETQRWLLFRLAGDSILDNPLVGIGPGQSKHQLGNEELWSPNVAHNTLLEAGLAGGIPMILITLATMGLWIVRAFGSALRSVYRTHSHNQDSLYWLALASTIISFCLIAMTLDLLTTRHFGVFIGWCLGVSLFSLARSTHKPVFSIERIAHIQFSR